MKLQSEREKSVWNPPLAVFTLGHLTDVDLLGLGEILIAQDENNVAGFHWLWFSIYAFDDADLSGFGDVDDVMNDTNDTNETTVVNQNQIKIGLYSRSGTSLVMVTVVTSLL